MAITEEEVFKAMQELQEAGADRYDVGLIREKLGDTGSKTTITKYRNKVREAENSPVVEIPAQLQRAIATAWTQQYRKSVDDALAMSTARVALAEKRAEEAAAELSTVAGKCEQLEKALSQQRQMNSTLKSEARNLSRQLDKRSAEAERLKGQMDLIMSQQKAAEKATRRAS